MKPFNLEEALSGKPIQTRDGVPVTLIKEYRATPGNLLPLLVLIHRKDYDEARKYRNDGRYFNPQQESNEDLVMATGKKEVWVNIYPDCGTMGHPTKENADDAAHSARLACIKIEYEE